MDVEWKLFADIAERAGDRAVPVTVSPDATVEDALAALLAARPVLADRVRPDGALAGDVSIVRNGVDLPEGDLERRVEAGDELALLPPMSGG